MSLSLKSVSEEIVLDYYIGHEHKYICHKHKAAKKGNPTTRFAVEEFISISCVVPDKEIAPLKPLKLATPATDPTPIEITQA